MSVEEMMRRRRYLLGIDENTLHNVALAKPTILRHLDAIVEALYAHLMSIPECARLLEPAIVPRLKARQKAHWARMLECRFDEAYARETARIGQVHFDRRVPPYLYLAAYSYTQSLIVARVSAVLHNKDEVAAVISSISRIILLDIELSLSAYTRAFWHGEPEASAVFL